MPIVDLLPVEGNLYDFPAITIGWIHFHSNRHHLSLVERIIQTAVLLAVGFGYYHLSTHIVIVVKVFGLNVDSTLGGSFPLCVQLYLFPLFICKVLHHLPVCEFY